MDTSTDSSHRPRNNLFPVGHFFINIGVVFFCSNLLCVDKISREGNTIRRKKGRQFQVIGGEIKIRLPFAKFVLGKIECDAH